MKQITEKIQKDYFETPKYNAPRNGNYELCEKISAKWIVTNRMADGCNGNLAYGWVFDSKIMKVITRPDYNTNPDYFKDARYYDFGKAIPACLALYKLIQIFKAMPTDRDNDWYKVTWSFTLTHKETGEKLSLGEHKAAFSFWTRFVSEVKGNKPFFNDIKELIEFMLSDKVPHTYDRVSAGSVA